MLKPTWGHFKAILGPFWGHGGPSEIQICQDGQKRASRAQDGPRWANTEPVLQAGPKVRPSARGPEEGDEGGGKSIGLEFEVKLERFRSLFCWAGKKVRPNARERGGG